MGCFRCVCLKNSDATSWHKLLHKFGPFCTEFCKATKWSKCIQIVQNTPKHDFRVQWGGSVAFVVKSSDTTSWHKLFTTSAHFEPSFLRHPNGTKCTQIVWNAPKHKFRSQQGQSGVFVAKNSDTTSWHELLHHFSPFCTEFCKVTKRYQMHPNSTKHTITWV